MLKLFQKLTSPFSISGIVILGVGVMALVLVGFALTMTYLSTTIKSDQKTLEEIVALQKQNHQVLDTIKNINYLNNKILVSSKLQNLETLEQNISSNFDFKTIDIKDGNLFFEEYNSHIKKMQIDFENIISLQEDIFTSKTTILSYEEELQIYKKRLDNLIKTISNETESIFGKASLLTKRYNKSIRNLKIVDGETLNNKLLFDLGHVITIANDLNNSILRLPTYILKIDSSSNSDMIVSIQKNSLSQLISLLEDSLIRLSKYLYIEESFEKSVNIINSDLLKIKEQSIFFTLLKKQYLKEKINLKELLSKNETLNNELFNEINILNDISDGIKVEILDNSNSIYKKTTTIIIIVGVISLLLLSMAATTLISRINIPLEFIIKYMDSIISKKRTLSSKLPIFTNDEYGKLSKSFNKMTSIISENIKEIKHLNKEIEGTQKEVIFTMGAIGESRSKETGNHVKRVAEYSRILAMKYGLSIEDAELLKEASPMHDIGKVGIADSILKKEDKLTPDEWQIMKTHAQLGFEMLKNSNRKIFKAAATVAHEHHEKWDGSGYPRGIKGEDIHIFGRITAVADVFDALASDRCYKKAWSIDAVKKFFEENKGKHFEPKLVDILFENFDELLYVKNRYNDIF